MTATQLIAVGDLVLWGDKTTDRYEVIRFVGHGECIVWHSGTRSARVAPVARLHDPVRP